MTKKWSVLAVMAGDNSLDGAAVQDLKEMEVSGSTDDVEILAQVDRAKAPGEASEGEGTTRRYRITKSGNKNKIGSEILADLGPTNTGDPKTIQDFLRYGAENAKADRTMIVLWNHGSGFYVPPEMLKAADAPGTREIKKAKKKLQRSFFSSSRKEILSQPSGGRGILYDDSSADCLDNAELKRVVKYAHGQLGRKIDVLGMDACLMTMLEVAYQIRDHVEVLVGSEEVEPEAGWPYDKVLPALAKKPSMTGKELAGVVVDRYVKSYAAEGDASNVTQSALDLTKLGDLTEAVDALAKAILAGLDNAERGAVMMAANKATRFYDKMYADLYDFAGQLLGRSERATVKVACQGVLDAIDGRGAETPLLAERHAGSHMSRVRGISIYLPPTWSPSVYYGKLDFAKKTKWGKLLQTLLA